MKVLVACEFSGIVRDAFKVKGHEAMSCDLIPTESPGPHYQGNVLDVLNDGWDLMIAHPPCTDLATSGARYFPQKIADGRQQAAIIFFMALANAPVERICIENPVGIMSRIYRKPDQIIQPWQFGKSESKKTCLWLHKLPLLIPTKILEPKYYGCSCGFRFTVDAGKYGCPNCLGKGKVRYIWDNQTPTGQNKLGPNADRTKNRSITYQGIANAMAQQWG